MTASVPVVITRDGRGYEMRSVLSLGEPVRGRGPTLANARARFAAQLRKLLEKPREFRNHPTMLLGDADFEPHYVRGRLDLRGDKARPFRLLVLEQHLPEQSYAHVPRLEITFDRDARRSLAHDTAEVVARVLTQRRRQGTALPPLDDGRSSIWFARVEVSIDAGAFEKEDISGLITTMMTGIGSGASELRRTGRCLDDLDPATALRCHEREDVLQQVAMRLQAADRPAVLLLGEPGVGKSMVVHELAMRAQERRRDTQFTKRRGPASFWHLSPSRLIAGMMYQGQWEQRLEAILAHAAAQDLVLWFDDLLGLTTAGRSRGTELVMADVLKAAIENGRCRVLGEATPGAMRVLGERHRALAESFEVVRMRPTDAAATRRLVLHTARLLERVHPVVIEPAVLQQVSPLAARAPAGQVEPGRSLRLLHRLVRDCAPAAAADGSAPREHIDPRRLRQQTAVPALNSPNKILQQLRRRIRGQERATEVLAAVMQRAHYGLHDPSRPIQSMLFVGPTGVGKTESAKALASALFRDGYDDDRSRRHLLRFDMNQYGTYGQAQRLIGTFDAPDGHLTAAVRRTSAAVVLFDEIEKAHPVVFDLLLQLLDDGRLTDARGETVDFRFAIVVMTSNLGAVEARDRIGLDEQADPEVYENAVRRFFRPELFNRIDRVVPFEPLTKEHVRELVGLELSHIGSRYGLQRREVLLECTASAQDRLAELGYHPHLGARALQRALRHEVLSRLAEPLAAARGRGHLAVILCVAGEITVALHHLQRVERVPVEDVGEPPEAFEESIDRMFERLAAVERGIAALQHDGRWTMSEREEFTRLLLEPLAVELEDVRSDHERDVGRARGSQPTDRLRREPPGRSARVAAIDAGEIDDYLEQRGARRTWDRQIYVDLELRLRMVERISQRQPRGASLVWFQPFCGVRDIGREQSVMTEILGFARRLDVAVEICEVAPLDDSYDAETTATAVVAKGLFAEFLAWSAGGDLDLYRGSWSEFMVAALPDDTEPSRWIAELRERRGEQIAAVEAGGAPPDSMRPAPIVTVIRLAGPGGVEWEPLWTDRVVDDEGQILPGFWERFRRGEPGSMGACEPGEVAS